MRSSHRVLVRVACVAFTWLVFAACTHDFGAFVVSADASAGTDAQGADGGAGSDGSSVVDAARDAAAPPDSSDAAVAVDAADSAMCKPARATCAATAQCCTNLTCQDDNGTLRCL